MTDDPAAIRAVLREHGIEVPDRGPISAENMARYEDIRAGRTGDDDWVGADEPGADADDEPGFEPPGDEKPPRRPKGAGAKSTAKTWWDRQRTGTGKKRKAKTRPARVQHPRVKVDDLIATGWELLGRLSKPVSVPVSRTFALQAPVAGMVLEDAVRGTMVDRILQPLARTQQRGRAVVALAGPPLIVAAIERAQGLEEPFRSVRLEVLTTMLEESMLLWQDVAGGKFAEAERRMAAREEDRKEVRRLIDDVIFAGPVLCGKLVATTPDGTRILCEMPADHRPPCAVSEDTAARYAQTMAGAA